VKPPAEKPPAEKPAGPTLGRVHVGAYDLTSSVRFGSSARSHHRTAPGTIISPIAVDEAKTASAKRYREVKKARRRDGGIAPHCRARARADNAQNRTAMAPRYADGVDANLAAKLVNRGLAILIVEEIRAGEKLIAVAKVRITIGLRTSANTESVGISVPSDTPSSGISSKPQTSPR
jgi:hypothetical protein